VLENNDLPRVYMTGRRSGRVDDIQSGSTMMDSVWLGDSKSDSCCRAVW